MVTKHKQKKEEFQALWKEKQGAKQANLKAISKFEKNKKGRKQRRNYSTYKNYNVETIKVRREFPLWQKI